MGNGCETTTAGVLSYFPDQKRSRWKNCEELEMNYEEQGKNDRTLMRIYCMEWRGLTGADEMRRLPPFLWTGSG